jgi:hypothetical protein
MWKFVNPRYRREGDIHVFKDDHIEWDAINVAILANGGEVVLEMDYLLFKRDYDMSIYCAYKNEINDMHLLVARKK